MTVNTEAKDFTFSIILETENMAYVDPEALLTCVETLEGSNISLTEANEFIIINTGLVPEKIAKELKDRYPWITIMEFPEEIDYYQAKMEGFLKTTGDIIVFCDSDCEYHNNWLDYSIEPFLKDPSLEVVGGETSVRVRGIIDLAMLLVWIFPPYSGRKEVFDKGTFYLNNVLFRKELINEQSFVKKVNLYRSDGAVYHKQLIKAGKTIWSNPLAKAYHPRPESFKLIFWRLMLNSHSTVFRHCLNGKTSLDFQRLGIGTKTSAFFKSSIKWLGRPFKRMFQLKSEQVRNFAMIPFALPVVLIFQIILIGGTIVSLTFPGFVYRKSKEVLDE